MTRCVTVRRSVQNSEKLFVMDKIKFEIAKLQKRRSESAKMRRRSAKKGESAKAKELYYYRSCAFATSHSLLRNFALAFLCVCLDLFQLKIILAKKLRLLQKSNFEKNISNKESLMMKFKFYCVYTSVSRLVSGRSLDTHYGYI